MEEEKKELEQEEEVDMKTWWDKHPYRDKDMRKLRHYRNKAISFFDTLGAALCFFGAGLFVGAMAGLIFAYPFCIQSFSVISDLLAIYGH